jgi:Holliday junction resolvase-like predicted endonuclease
MYSKIKNDYQARAGRFYEDYVARSLKFDGWEVLERGKYSYYDRGIDLIASKDEVTRYIQCKNLKFWKYIIEDVVHQLYGSVVAKQGAENLKGVEMYIYSPGHLSEFAKNEAKKLNIHFIRKGVYRKHKPKI